ncbi:lipid A deacylase LpxR family protein [Kiloniella laminariae]|uniref:Lipid A deacylase LpxR family protein n=1 Tax=Kiloniella laminariae TaxID=454162 RepID=A0ABT4LGY0_9PROT|nr:lipid A deacylase LpxR family protein [Kiloniella laminariae]MCZ4279601.1 lipid A deacylase LpxR family protein [Kiloniella laminariae]
MLSMSFTRLHCRKLLVSLGFAGIGMWNSNLALSQTAAQETTDTPQEQPVVIETPTLEQQARGRIFDKKRDQIITLVIENDSLGAAGTDKNYTSGVRLGYLDLNADLPEVAYALDEVIPTFGINDTSSVFYSVGQNLYSPENIRQREQDPDDRPWAAHLYGSMGLVTITGNHVDEVEASVGIVGPAALGEQAQKFVHTHVTPDSPTPRGWSNQLNHEPTLSLGWQRRYPKALSVEGAGMSLAASPYYGAMLGNVHTFADVGVTFRLAPVKDQWQDNPVRVRPGLPGTGAFEVPEDGWSWYLFAGAEGRAVAQNIFLDGNTFSDSHSVDKKVFVADLNAGLAMTYEQYRISYTMIYRTKEFEGQDDPGVFGAVSFGYQF